MKCAECGNKMAEVGSRQAKGITYQVYQCPKCYRVQYKDKA